MNYSSVQKLIESHLQSVLTATALTFENQPFDTDIYNEFTRATIQFGDSILQSLGTRCYRTIGIIFLDFFVRPGVGAHRLVQLSDAAASLLVGQTLTAVLPNVAPNVSILEPSLSKNFAERTGWVSAQLRLTFHFDTEV